MANLQLLSGSLRQPLIDLDAERRDRHEIGS
jgi:hypothetical protein